MPMDTILVVNAGSSSVKFQVFAVDDNGRLRRQIKGQMDGIGSRPRLRATGPAGDTLAERAYPLERVPDVPAALMLASAWLRDELQLNPLAVGHRVVHGGPDYDRAVLIDRGHRELPIEANFIGKKIPTKDNEVVEVKLKEIDGEDAIYVMEKI